MHFGDLYVFDADLGASSCRLTVNSDVMEIVHAMSAPDSSLEIRDRMWLKITIPNAFIGKLNTSVETGGKLFIMNISAVCRIVIFICSKYRN